MIRGSLFEHYSSVCVSAYVPVPLRLPYRNVYAIWCVCVCVHTENGTPKCFNHENEIVVTAEGRRRRHRPD